MGGCIGWERASVVLRGVEEGEGPEEEGKKRQEGGSGGGRILCGGCRLAAKRGGCRLAAKRGGDGGSLLKRRNWSHFQAFSLQSVKLMIWHWRLFNSCTTHCKFYVFPLRYHTLLPPHRRKSKKHLLVFHEWTKVFNKCPIVTFLFLPKQLRKNRKNLTKMQAKRSKNKMNSMQV